MKMRFISAVTAAVIMAATLGACGNAIKKNKNVSADMGTLTTADEDSTDGGEIITDRETTDGEEQTVDEVKSFPEAKIKAAELKYEEFDKTYQAESGKISGGATGADSRDGYKGDGYVTGISEESDWSLTFDVPSEQYYNIIIRVASDSEASGGLSLNGNKLSEFTTSDEGKFETRAFRNIKLKKGENKVAIIPEAGSIDIDQVQVSASEEISKLSLSAEGASLSDENAWYNAKALYKFLCDNYGSKVILAQNDTAGTNYESELIYSVTGKYPAIRLGDMMYVTGKEHEEQAAAELEQAIAWHKAGGIVGYMWNWYSPSKPDDSESVYAENAEFDLSKAVTDEDVALMSIETLERKAEEGDISEECLQLMKDIDAVSEQLEVLRDEGAPVLWRPLQEASNGMYWWGQDEEAYLWLWKTMYDRMTDYYGLHNLVWVWSAQNANWFVGGEYCDLLSADVYGGGKDGQVNTLLYLQKVAGGKPIAMSECDSMPLIQSIADERAMWSYIGQWGGSFIVGEDGGLSQAYNNEQDIITMYNNNLTITRDKLPDFESLAEEVKKAEKEAAEKKKESEDDE